MRYLKDGSDSAQACLVETIYHVITIGYKIVPSLTRFTLCIPLFFLVPPTLDLTPPLPPRSGNQIASFTPDSLYRPMALKGWVHD
jgi:hypothetical protein